MEENASGFQFVDFANSLITVALLRDNMSGKGESEFAKFCVVMIVDDLGDNIFGSSTTDAAESLLEAIGPAIEYGIPWAAILGNHDQESTMDRQELMTFLSLMDFSVSQINPPAGDEAERGALRSVDGFGNYHLRVHGAPGSVLSNSTVFDLFFLDSGDRETVQGRRTYGWIKESQLRWLQDASKQVKRLINSYTLTRSFILIIYTLVKFH